MSKIKKSLLNFPKKPKKPRALLQCQWQSNKNQGQNNTRMYKSHFKTCQMVLEFDLCVGAMVSLSGINIVPEAGLYNGARGKLIDFVYDNVCGPNDKHG